MPFKDKEKARTRNAEYQHKWYQDNKTKHKGRVRRRMLRNRIWVYAYKKKQACIKCGSAHPAVLDFHHRFDEDKEFNISMCRNFSLARIKAEIAKCDVLCANCHRILHWDDCTGPFKNRILLEAG